LAAALLVSIGGCSEGIELFVDLQSDFVAGVEVDEARIQLFQRDPSSPAPIREVTESLSTADDLFTGKRVAELSDLTAGEYLVRVILLNRGATRARTDLRVSVLSTRAVGITIARTCDGLMCPGPTDATEATACRAGRCYDSTCAEPTCRPTDCTASADCGGPACAQRECADGQCLLFPDDDACPAGSRCDAVEGCVEDIPIEDSGVRDTSVDADADAGDTSVDSAPPCMLGVADPGFVDPGAWTSRGSSGTVEAGMPGGSGPGVAVFAGAGACDSQLVQTVCNPAPTMPLVLSVLAQVTGRMDRTVPGITLGASPTYPLTLERSTTYTRLERCLGEAAHTSSFEIGLGGTAVEGMCGDSADLRFDEVELRPALMGECPAPGTVLNGGFESDEGWSYPCCGSGWEFDGSDPTDRVLHLSSMAGWRAEMLGTVSVASLTTMANPALELRYRTRGDISGTPYAVSLDLDVYGPVHQNVQFPDSPTETTARLCVDPVNAGHAMLMMVSFAGATAGPTLAVDIWVDDIRLVDDPTRCP